MRKAAAGLLAALLSLPPAPASAFLFEATFLGPADGRALLKRLAEPKRALGADAQAVAGHFSPLVKVAPAFPYDLLGAVPGLSYVRATGLEGLPRETFADLRFSGLDKADAFRARIDAAFGPPDPACTDATRAHWSLGPDLSLAWSVVQYKWASASFWLTGADPRDANCAVSAAGPDGLVSQEEMAILMTRLREEPPPFSDPEAMADWLAPYGAFTLERGDCDASLFEHSRPPRLSGFAFASAELRLCPSSSAIPGTLTLLSGDSDMFGKARALAAAEAVLGPPHAPCTDEGGTVFVLDERTTVVVTDLYLSFGLLVVDGTPEILGCG